MFFFIIIICTFCERIRSSVIFFFFFRKFAYGRRKLQLSVIVTELGTKNVLKTRFFFLSIYHPFHIGFIDNAIKLRIFQNHRESLSTHKHGDCTAIDIDRDKKKKSSPILALTDSTRSRRYEKKTGQID